MGTDFPESDWRAFRKLREIALERFCERVVTNLNRIAADADLAYHSRYRSIYELIEERDRELADAFDNPRRSTALFQLALMVSLDLVADEELRMFTAGTRSVVQSLVKPGNGTNR